MTPAPTTQEDAAPGFERLRGLLLDAGAPHNAPVLEALAEASNEVNRLLQLRSALDHMLARERTKRRPNQHTLWTLECLEINAERIAL